MQILDTHYQIGQIVFLITDPEQSAYMVTGYQIRKDSIKYILSIKGHEDYFYDFEINDERDIVKSTSN